MSVNVESNFASVVERAWADDAFKARLLEDSTAVLREAGITVPPGITVKVVENTESLIHVVMPAKPQQEAQKAAESDGNCCGSCMPE